MNKNNKYGPRLIAWEVTRTCLLNYKHCRARAFAICGDYMNEERYCIYQPKKVNKNER